MTDGFRYIGIQPPLTQNQEELLRAADQAVPTSFSTREPHTGDPYSEWGLFIEAFMTPRLADKGVLRVANNIAEVLSRAGDAVQVNEALQPIGLGYYLFGGQAERLG